MRWLLSKSEPPRGNVDHRPVAGLPQPHWQFCSWQRHAFFSHPQEQVPHPQLHFAAFFVLAFSTFDIFSFSFFVQRFMRFHRG